MPDGQQGNYLWFSNRRDAVTVIARDSTGRILVEQEYSYLPNVQLYQFAGGGVEEGEQPETAAQRELAEELDYQAGKLTLIGSYLMDHRRSHSKMYVFLGQDLAPLSGIAKSKYEKDKYEIDLQHFWLTEAKVDGLIAEHKVVNATMLAAWVLYKHH